MPYNRHALEREYAAGNEDLDRGHQYWHDVSNRSDWKDEEALPTKVDWSGREKEVDSPAVSDHISSDWRRPTITDKHIPTDSRKDDFFFLVNHVDYVVGDNVTVNDSDVPGYVPVLPQDEPIDHEKVPSFRLFGIDEHGADVLMHVHGYLPYFYVDSGTLERMHGKPGYDALCQKFCAAVEKRLNDLVTDNINQWSVAADGHYVHSVCVEEKLVAYGHQEATKPVLTITMVSPKFVVCARSQFEWGQFRRPEYGWCFHTYEPNIDYVVRFMSQLSVVGHGWIRIPAGAYSLRSCMKRPDRLMRSAEYPHQLSDMETVQRLEKAAVTNGVQRTSYCNIEGDVHYRHLDVLDHNAAPWNKHGQYVSVSYDIEVLNSTKEFPDPMNAGDRICSIAAYVTLFGDTRGANPVHKVRVFGLGSSDEIDPLDAEEVADARTAAEEKGEPFEEPALCEPTPVVYSFGDEVDDDDAERSLILNYARFIRSLRPDMITGWNIDRFDGNYLCKRAEYLGIADKLNFGRIIGETSRIRSLTFQNNAAGKTEFNILTASGVVDFDAFNVAKKDVYLSVRKYDLNTVSEKLLKMRKKDMPYEMISPTYYGSPEGRGEVHSYCGQDCRLVWKNIVAAGWHYSYITQARAAGVPLQYMCFRGVQIRILAKELQVMHPLGMIMPYIRDDVNRTFFRGKYSKTTFKRKHGFVWDDRDESVGKKRKSSKKKRAKGYSGGSVLEPERGWHEDPIGILDFASLYPNEMLEKNLCYSTVILDPDQRKRLRQGYDYRVTASGAAFVLEHVKRGIIPIILHELLTLRKVAKKMKSRYTKGKDVEWDIYEGQQMGLKLLANSVYGSLGTLHGIVVNFDVAEAVTTSGRRDLLKTCDLIKAIFANRESFGYEREYVRDADGKYVRDDNYQRIRKLVPDGKGGTTWPYVCDEHGEKILKISCDALIVIYGDTGKFPSKRDQSYNIRCLSDSVFVKLVGVRDKREGFRIGKNVEQICNAYFRPPMKLEFENLMDGILLLKKKRYCGYATPSPDKPYKLLVKGLEYKRRDNAAFVKKLWEQTLEITLKDKRPRDALDHVRAFIRKLMSGQVEDRKQFVITQALTQNIEEYANKGAHVAVAAKMTERNPNNAPTCGDRVEYVICKGPKGAKIFERAEEPDYANDPANGLEIDYLHYAMKQIVVPFMKLFRPVLESDMIRRKDLTTDIQKHKTLESGVGEEKTTKIDAMSVMMNSAGRFSVSTKKQAQEYLFGEALRTRPILTKEAMATKNAKRKRAMVAMFGNAPPAPANETDRMETKEVRRKRQKGKRRKKKRASIGSSRARPKKKAKKKEKEETENGTEEEEPTINFWYQLVDES